MFWGNRNFNNFSRNCTAVCGQWKKIPETSRTLDQKVLVNQGKENVYVIVAMDVPFWIVLCHLTSISDVLAQTRLFLGGFSYLNMKSHIPSGAELLPTGKKHGGITGIFCNRYSYHYQKIF
eukprot:3128314-Amphidinium_carterae.1